MLPYGVNPFMPKASHSNHHRLHEHLQEICRLLAGKPYTTQQLLLRLQQDEPNLKTRSVQRYLLSLKERGEVEKNSAVRPPTYTLAQLSLSPVEALVTHCALRLLYHHTPGYNAVYTKALKKLAEKLPEPAQSIALKSTDEHKNKHLDQGENLAVVAQGWFNGQRIAFEYLKPGGSGRPRRNELEVHFIEVNRSNLGLYVIGLETAYHKAPRTFKLDRMRGVHLIGEPKAYSIAATFDPKIYLSNAWGVVGSSGGKPVEVRLRFGPEEAYRLREAGYPNFDIRAQPDQSIEVRFTVGTTNDGFPLEVLSWVQSWGSRVEVLEPLALRKRWLEEALAVSQKGEE
jgi:predicted DNA-binding transcriptional regulator YafY